MTNIPDPEPTPLRLRLGPRAESVWQPPVENVTDADDLLAADEALEIGPETDPRAETIKFDDVETEPSSEPRETPQTAPWSDRLNRARAETDRRVERWVADQQRRLVAGLDLMLAQLKEQRQQEARRLEAWKVSERQRVERELDEEEAHFRARLMDELRAFEEQLGLRLIEQEERLARWWDEAERLAERRFADLGLSGSGEAPEPPAS